MQASLTRQAGHAALLFAIMSPAFFAIFILGSDGARALQTKARLEDASEVAVLAIAAHNSDSAPVNNEIARNYIEQYMTDINSVKDIKVTKLSCERIPECKNRADGDPRFFQYKMETDTDYNSWFPNSEGIAGLGEKFSVAGSAIARKYQSEAIDVMFVTDYSNSMSQGWDGGSKAKYQDLTDIIADVTDELEKFNDIGGNNQINRVGNSSYNKYTHSGKNKKGKYKYVSQLKLTNGNVNYNMTVNSIFIEKDKLGTTSNQGTFYDISLTDNFSTFNSEMKKFSPKPANGFNFTASFEGIMRGAQLLEKGTNARRLMIVLSDGNEIPKVNKQHMANLVNKGMCTKIISELGNDIIDGKKVTARLTVIGFDYDVNKNKPLSDCVGSDNVFKAENKNDILNKILELISEEIGHLS